MESSTLSNPNLNPPQMKTVLLFSLIMLINIKLCTYKYVIYGNGCPNETDYATMLNLVMMD